MKALILAAGRGKRMGEVCNERNKCLLEINGKPIIEYSLDCATKIDLSEILIVVGHHAEKIINNYGNIYKEKSIQYVFQPEQKGLVHAIERAKELLNGEDFMLMLGDELMINPRHPEMIKKYYNENLFSICGVLSVEDRSLVKKTYAIVQGKDDEIHRLIEKPQSPPNNIMGTGNCIFRNEILSYIDQIKINPIRKEKELVDLMQCAIDNGHTVKYFPVCDKYFNINYQEDLKNGRSYFLHS